MGILMKVVKDMFARQRTTQAPTTKLAAQSSVCKVLNVGGGSKSIPIPDYFAGWRHDLLDIDDRGCPDLVCDARALLMLPGRQYEAVYCSHNLLIRPQEVSSRRIFDSGVLEEALDALG